MARGAKPAAEPAKPKRASRTAAVEPKGEATTTTVARSKSKTAAATPRATPAKRGGETPAPAAKTRARTTKGRS